MCPCTYSKCEIGCVRLIPTKLFIDSFQLCRKFPQFQRRRSALPKNWAQTHLYRRFPGLSKKDRLISVFRPPILLPWNWEDEFADLDCKFPSRRLPNTPTSASIETIFVQMNQFTMVFHYCPNKMKRKLHFAKESPPK